MSKTIIVTGGAGFIGSALVRQLIANTSHQVVNVDKLTYAGNLESLLDVQGSSRYSFERVDICDGAGLERIFSKYQPNAVIHLAAETHVDRSIDGPDAFIRTNVLGTSTLLRVASAYWCCLSPELSAAFRFLHVSTDEVYGELGPHGAFLETTAYGPRSPYSASKAASDHLVRAWHHTYGFPTIVTNCSNNFGPYQFPEKLIPVVVLRAISGQQIPVYGHGGNVRDWLFVDDHVEALIQVLQRGRVGETYNIGGQNERTNLQVVEAICSVLDEINVHATTRPHSRLISFVQDRPGHDWRYAIDATKVREELGWTPRETFEPALRRTVEWYIQNSGWCARIISGEYRLERLGIGGRAR